MGQHVAAHVVDRGQPEPGAVGVQETAERPVEALTVLPPALGELRRVVGRRVAPHHQHRRRMVGRRQYRRAIRCEHVGQPAQLGDGRRSDLERGRSDHHVALFGQSKQRLELGGDRLFDHLPAALGGDRRCGCLTGRLEFRTDRRVCEAEPFGPASEIGRRAEVRQMAERLQLQRQRHQRLNVTPRADGGQQHPHRIRRRVFEGHRARS